MFIYNVKTQNVFHGHINQNIKTWTKTFKCLGKGLQNIENNFV